MSNQIRPRPLRAAALVVTLGLLSAGLLVRADEPSVADTADQRAIQELRSLEDPTIVKRRVWLETEWNRFDDGSDNLEQTLGGLWAWGLSRNLDWAVRLKLPYEWHFAGDAVGDADARGLGDIKLATGLAYRLSETWRVGGGLELRLPTAEDGLGDDVWKLQEFGTVAWDATRWLTFTPTFEYNQSLAEQSGAAPQHNLELFFPAMIVLPQRWSVTARYEMKVDFEQDNDVSQSAKLYLSKQLHPSLGFTCSVEKPLDSSNKDFQFNFVLTWFFRSEKNEPAK